VGVRIDLLALPILAGVLLAACGARGDPEAGERLYTSFTIGRADAPGCITCHSLEAGEIKVGPSHAGIARRAAEVIQQSNYTGSATTAEGYLRESILVPDAYVEAGFPPGVMYQAYSQTLTEGELADIVAFLISLE